MLKDKLKNNEGLTLMEILVSIAIMVTMLSITMLGNGSLGSSRKVKMTVQKMASDIRKMQSFVLNLQDHNGNFPEGGWGININKGVDNTKYNLFADTNFNSVTNEHVLNDSTNELSQAVGLPNGLLIGDIYLDVDASNPYSNTTETNVNISFSPPDPETWICQNSGSNCNFVRARIEIKNYDGTNSKYIYINEYGLIDIEDN